MIVLHTAIAISAVVFLIIAFKVDPVISLIVGSLYLGLASGLGFEGTIEAIVDGFGSIMTKVGLLIGFGVLIGSLLLSMNSLQRFVTVLLRRVGVRRLPYVMASVMTAIFPSIYADVQLVLAAPLAREAAPRLGKNGLGIAGGALTTGILVGYVFVVPSLGTISIAGLLGVPLGNMLGYGLLVGLLTAGLTVFLFNLLIRLGLWDPAKDETTTELALTTSSRDTDVAKESHLAAAGATITKPVSDTRHYPSLSLALSPVLIPLCLIAFGALAELNGLTHPLISFLGDPIVALFLGLTVAYLLAKATIGTQATETAVSQGFSATGQILLVTGVGGSLGAVIGDTNLKDVLSSLFSADAAAPVIVSIFVAWLVAAVLHLAIGSITVAAVAAAGIVGPIIAQLDVSPAVIGLAIGAGALFAMHVNSNFFWMFKTLLGVSTRGALKAVTLVTSISSVVALPMIIGLGMLV